MKYKNSTIFLKDWAILVQSLPKDDQLVFWDLFMNYPTKECDNTMVLPIWNFVKLQLDNMNKSYNEKVVERNKINGSKGGRPKTKTNPKNPVGLKETQKTLNDNENENINENENNNDNEILTNFKKIEQYPHLNIHAITDLIEFAKTDEIYKDNFKRLYQGISYEKALEGFEIHLRKSGILRKSYTEFQNHFMNWINKKDNGQ